MSSLKLAILSSISAKKSLLSKQKEIEINAVIISHLRDLRYSSVSSSSY
jgi:hypothetical protein